MTFIKYYMQKRADQISTSDFQELWADKPQHMMAFYIKQKWLRNYQNEDDESILNKLAEELPKFKRQRRKAEIRLHIV